MSQIADRLQIASLFYTLPGETPSDAARLVMDLLAPRGQRGGGDGFALLWRDRSPHEQPHWRISVADTTDPRSLLETVEKRLGRPDRVEQDDWVTARNLFRKRAEPARLVAWGAFADALSELHTRQESPAVFLPLALGLDRSHPVMTLPVLERVLEPERPAAEGITLADACTLGVALGRVMLAESWQETTCAEKTDYFQPMREWHFAWASAALVRLMQAWPARPAVTAPWPGDPNTDRAAWVGNYLAHWIAETVFTAQAPAHRNAFLAGLSHAAWLDEDLQEYLEPQQRSEVFASLLPYCRWFLAMGLCNHLGPDLPSDPHRDAFHAALTEALPELAELDGFSDKRDIEQRIIRISEEKAAAAFAELVLPYCDLMLPPLFVSDG